MKNIVAKKQRFFNWKKIIFWIGLGIFYLALAVVFTWPLIKNFNSAIIGQSDFTDGPFFLWNIWWVKKAILSFQNPFFSNFVYYPENVNLTLHTLTYTTALIALPLTLAFSLITTLNIVLFSSIIASALGMTLLVQYLTKNKWAGIISGVVFAFNPYLFSHLEAGHYNLTMLWIFPFLALFFIKTLKESSKVNPIIFSSLLVAQSYLDLQLAVFSIIIVGLIFVFNTIFDYKIILNKHTLIRILLSVSLYILFFAAPYIYLMFGFWGHKELSSTYNNGDLKIIFGANPLNPIFGKLNLDMALNMIGSYRENVISLGRSTMFMAVLALFFSREKIKERIMYFLIAVVGIILAAGPYLQIGGAVFENIRLPFYYLAKLPFFNVGVVPTRFVIIAYFALAILVGFLVSDIYSYLSGKKLKVLAIVAALFLCIPIGLEFYSGTMKIDKLAHSPILDEIASDAGEFTVLPFNASARDGYYQTFFNKKVVSGYLGRRIHDYYLKQYWYKPTIDYIISADEKTLSADDYNLSLAKKSFLEYKVKYVTVDKTVKSPDRISKIKTLMSRLGYKVWREDKLLIVYKLY